MSSHHDKTEILDGAFKGPIASDWVKPFTGCDPESNDDTLNYGNLSHWDTAEREYRRLVHLAQQQIKANNKPYNIRLTFQWATGDFDNSEYILSWSRHPK